jgi:hypothetical protein
MPAGLCHGQQGFGRWILPARNTSPTVCQLAGLRIWQPGVRQGMQGFIMSSSFCALRTAAAETCWRAGLMYPGGACWGSPPWPSARWPGAASPSTTQTAMPGMSTVHARRTLFSKPGYSKRNPRPADNPSGTPVPTDCRRALQGCTCSTIEIPYHRPHACRRTTR